MSLDLLKLPRRSTLSIISFLDLRSCVRLRMICKQFKEIVDESILCIKSCVTKLDIESTEGEVKFHFGFLSNKYYAQWKIWLIRQSTIQGFDFEAKLPILIASVKSPELEKFCELLKSLRKVTVEMFGAPTGEDLNRMCCDFLEGKSVRIVSTCGRIIGRRICEKPQIQDWNSWMYVIKRLKPEAIRCRPFALDRDTINLLEEVANNVMCITFEMNQCRDDPSIPSFARRILSRKCEFLSLSAATFSVAEAESIVQFLHRSKKRVFLEVVVDEQPIRAQMDVGLYNIKFDFERITIKHRDIVPLFP